MATVTGKQSPAVDRAAAELGFREGTRSVHASRTLMLNDLSDLLAARGASATREDYRRALVDENVLGKKTMTARRNTFLTLAELYALDPTVAVFRALRRYWDLDAEGRRLLALLCAAARDPLLRASAATVLGMLPGEVFAADTLAWPVEESAPGRYSAVVRRAVASRLASSWAQAGHLRGVRTRRRSRPVTTPGNTAYALALGYLRGARGHRLFTTTWAKLLDRPEGELKRLAAEASRRGWLNYREAGAVVEVRFPGLFTPAEEGLLRGEG